jgi:hypothetical protein
MRIEECPLTLNSCHGQLLPSSRVRDVVLAVKGRQHNGTGLVELGQKLIVGLQVNWGGTTSMPRLPLLTSYWPSCTKQSTRKEHSTEAGAGAGPWFIHAEVPKGPLPVHLGTLDVGSKAGAGHKVSIQQEQHLHECRV